ncbi:hypothetical protein AAFN75_16860 [Algibacter sp. AS12]|uniref:hypothetical protein n=1 Tax=Algibacter sp. AS12 TaxID=3135773 RepID=UPI00398AAFB4
MIYKVFFTETSNDINEPYSHKEFLGLWEKKDGYLSEVRFPKKKISITENDNLIEVLKETRICKIYLENPDPEMTTEISVEETNQVRGIYYPRIYRGIAHDDLSSFSLLGRDKKTIEAFNIPIDENLLVNSIEQLNTLSEFLNKILRTVFPAPANFDAYGFDIRNLIILSATEFEAQITGILKINEIKPDKWNYTIIDFFKSDKLLRLSDYEVAFSRFPDIPTMSPFSSWKNASSFQSLDWYSNYNKIKHDREDNFHKSRLIDLLNSISACYILLLAQYGNRPIINETLSNYWKIVKSPQLDISEKLISPLKDTEWEVKKYNC